MRIVKRKAPPGLLPHCNSRVLCVSFAWQPGGIEVVGLVCEIPRAWRKSAAAFLGCATFL